MQRIIINPVVKDVTTFIHTASETNNESTQVEVRLMPGGGTPLHYHRNFSETFIAIEGTLAVSAGKGKIVMLEPGDTATIPPGKVHRFFNPGPQKIRFNVVINPGHTGFEHALYILYGLAGDGLTDNKGVPKKLSHMAIIGEMSEMYLPGVFRLMQPLFRVIATRARKKGVEQQLIEKYCRLYN
ncbi:MAG: cupin domain-containing protein [Chitinophagaceae bacterium]|nr:MAG: cupin domain-containing protein [Chitinophagaceae bacterium]